MGGIYLIQDGGGLVEMSETAYDSEAFLQEGESIVRGVNCRNTSPDHPTLPSQRKSPDSSAIMDCGQRMGSNPA